MYDDENTVSYDCEAVEEDWLEISYTQRHYLSEEDDYANVSSLPVPTRREKRKKQKTHAFGTNRKWVVRIAALVVMAALLIAMRFVDNGFVGDVFKTAKETYTSSLVNAFTSDKGGNVITIPLNYNVASVSEGDVVLNGGMLSLSLTDGIVSAVTENSATVKVSDKLTVVYSNLNDVLVSVGQELSYMDVIGKYIDSTTVNLLYKGEKITDITTVDYTLTWKI